MESALKGITSRNPDILSGALVFSGTRVPVETLFDYLEYSSLDDYLEGYPQVERASALKVIEASKAVLLS